MIPNSLTLCARAFAAIFLAPLAFMASAGSVQAASNIENACTIMQERETWHHATNAASKKWQVPMPALLAFIRHESLFKADAAGPNSTAYGFAQALDGTWNWYRKATETHHADRTNFADAVDFVAWYMVQTRKRTGLPLTDVASHYLAYHEGHYGYRSSRWTKKPKLISVSQKVAGIASQYEQQLKACDLGGPPEATASAPVGAPMPLAKPFGLSDVASALPRARPATVMMAELRPELRARR